MAEDYRYAPSVVLNRQKRREDGRVLPIKIYGSNSHQGTAIYVDPIRTLFDIGVQFQKIEDLQNTTDFIMVSHAHSDHLDWHSLNRFVANHPSILVLLPYFISIPAEYSHLDRNIRFVHDQITMTLMSRLAEKIIVTGLEVPHGKETTFSYVVEYQGAKILFSTDLSSTDHLPQLEVFEIIMIETNYDEDEFISKEGAGGAINHLSVQQALAYATTHITEYGKIIPLHFGPTMQNFNQLHE